MNVKSASKRQCYNPGMVDHQSNELSLREQEILKLVATGASNKEIAYKLVISPNTVKVHLRNIFTKIGAASRTEAAMYAVQNGLIETGALPNSLNKLPVAIYNLNQKEKLFGWVRNNRIAVALGLLLLLSGVIVIQLVINQARITEENFQALSTEGSRWIRLADMPTARAGLAGASDGYKIFAIGGEMKDGVTGTVEIYDIQTNNWIKGAQKPTAVKNIQAVMIGGKIYVPGGITGDGSPTNKLEIYNPAINVWETGASMPVPLSNYASISYEGKLYVLGGWDGDEVKETVYYYDPDQNSWDNLTSLKKARRDFGVAIIGSYAYIIGGWDGSILNYEVEVIPLASDTHEIDEIPEIKLPEARYEIAVVSIFDNIYILGGDIYRESELNPFGYHYSISSNQWGEIGEFIQKNLSDSAIILGGSNIYLIGGNSRGIYSKATYTYKAINIVFVPLAK
jgi:DNA-binding CsgD family transcriptional regulator/N-acetylneuraminic acid mutarotase